MTAGAVVLQPCDVVLTRSKSVFGRLIRWFERRERSGATVNHAGIIVVGGPIAQAVIVEALEKVYRRGFLGAYGGSGDQVAIYRPTNLVPGDAEAIVAEAQHFVGDEYGYAKILANAIDLGLFRGRYVLRRLAGLDRYPICSYLVAAAFQAAGYAFGCEPGAASPDDIWAFVRSRADKYTCVMELAEVPPKTQ